MDNGIVTRGFIFPTYFWPFVKVILSKVSLQFDIFGIIENLVRSSGR